MERKSGSSSRSPSLSRRPSLREKKKRGVGGGIVGGHGGGGKKERWLLTRKTWRYMTDAVGNLLPEYRSSRRGSLLLQTTAGPSGSANRAPGALLPHQLQQWSQQQQQEQQQQQQQQQQASASARVTKAMSPPTTSSSYPWSSFPSHRPGVTPTGPGPPHFSTAPSRGTSGGSGGGGPGGGTGSGHHSAFGGMSGGGGLGSSLNRYVNPAVDPENFPQVEAHFQDVCDRQKCFLLWTRSKAKGLSGPALRDMKIMKEAIVEEDKQQNRMKKHSGRRGDSSSYPDEYGDDVDVDDDDEYDEYGDEEQITIRERRKSSTASSTISVIGGAMSFFRPLSSTGATSTGQSHHGHADTTFLTVAGPFGEGQRILRTTAVQTDPFPEELLIHLKHIHAIQEERQKQFQKHHEQQLLLQQWQMQMQQHLQQQKLLQQQQQHGEGGGGDGSSSSSSILFGGGGLRPTEGSSTTSSGGGGGSNVIPGLIHPQLRSVVVSTSSSSPKETLIPIRHHHHHEGMSDGSSGGHESEESRLAAGAGETSVSAVDTATTATSTSTAPSKSAAGGEDKRSSEESGYSSSIGDTVMKYLRIMRKNSKADNKETIDRFKTVNYDRSLRYIKSKNVTVEEALEHEKNKASGGGGTAPVNKGEPHVEVHNEPSHHTSSRVADTTATSSPEATGTTATAAANKAKGIKSVVGGKGVKGKTVKVPKGKTVVSASPAESPTSPTSSSPPSSPTSPTAMSAPSAVVTTTTTTAGQEVEPDAEVASKLTPTKQALLAPGKKKKVAGTTTGAKKGTLVAGQLEMEAGSSSVVEGKTTNPSSALIKTSNVGSTTTETRGVGEYTIAVEDDDSDLPPSSPPPPPPPPSPPPPPVLKEAGIQAGESLICYLRKLSDFSYCSASASESPAELTSLSPRLSIATTSTLSSSEAVEGWYLQYQQHLKRQQQHAAQAQQYGSSSTTSSGIPTTTRSSFDAFDLYSSSFGECAMLGGDEEWEELVHRRLQALHDHQVHQQQQQQQPNKQHQAGSDGGGSSSSSTPFCSPTLSTERHRLNIKLQSSPILPPPPSTPSTPGSASHPGPSGSSGGGGGGGLMKSLFSSSFGLGKSSSSRENKGKPTSTTSLVTPPTTTSTSSADYLLQLGRTQHSSSSAAGLTIGLGFPPTTSSSPNLLSLVHSTSSPAPSHHHHHRHRYHLGGRSDRDLVGTSSSSSFGGGVSDFLGSFGLMRMGSMKSSGGGGGGGGGWGSKVSQKGQMRLPLTDYGTTAPTNNSSSSSAVMQKSKSSTSVGPCSSSPLGTSAPLVPLGGGGGGGGGGVGGRLASSKSSSSRIFKSRSKSSSSGGRGGVASSSAWAPQGRCKWRSPGGKTITIEAADALTLSEVERQMLQQVALEKLKALGFGSDVVKIPKERGSSSVTKPKRRPYLLKKKALSTGFFEGNRREDDKDAAGGGGGGSGMVFGIPLSQCVANDRLRASSKQGRQESTPQQAHSSTGAGVKTSSTHSSTLDQYLKRSQNGSRGSFSVDNSHRPQEHQQDSNKGSSESLHWGSGGKRGSTVTAAAAVSQLNETLVQPSLPAVPAIITACVEHLENYGLHTTGIFRVSTSLKRIRQLREEIDGGKEIELGEEHSPHDVAALLKEFLRDLPEPLLSRELYQAFLKTQNIRNRKQQLEAVQHLIHLLPPANRDTLCTLLKFFAKVVANAGETRGVGGEFLPGNKMEGYSLATLIAPNILPCMEGGAAAVSSPSADPTLAKERRESIDVVNYMISNFSQLFEISPELLHDVYLHLMDTQPESVEVILKQRSGVVDDPNMDEVETGSVFEGSECGDPPQPQPYSEEELLMASGGGRVVRRREDILHEGAGRGGSYPVERSRRMHHQGGGRKEGDGHLSGGESDSSSTKSSTKWFRRTRQQDKPRTASDSGGERLRGSGPGGGGGIGSSGVSAGGAESSVGLECKRASSLDSMNVATNASASMMMRETQDMTTKGKNVGRGGGMNADVKEKSSSDQSLKVPENLNRRQSSPVLESAGVITASLKIPVQVPLSIDDTDIPFIEDEHGQNIHPFPQQQHHHQQTLMMMSRTDGGSGSVARGRSASTDSSAVVKSASSSHMTTPISSPGRPSSEVSSPLGFSPPGSPPYDPGAFPYEEMTARILLGGGGGGSSSDHAYSSTATFDVSKGPTPRTVVSSLYVQPPAEPQQQMSTSTATVYIPDTRISPSSSWKDPNKSSNIGGLIKSKTADFEKLAKSSTPSSSTTVTSPASSSTTTAHPSSSPSTSTSTPIAPKMRLRSQENIMLKQQFLLRQQQLHQQQPTATTSTTTTSPQPQRQYPLQPQPPLQIHHTYPHPSQEEGRKATERQRMRDREAEGSSTTTVTSSNSGLRVSSSGSPGLSVPPRRRQPLAGSASSSAIPSTSPSPSPGLRPQQHSSASPSPSTTPVPPSPPSPTPTVASGGASGGGSGGRWKRSEIIASRRQEEEKDKERNKETFL